ncbi:MAG: hypothetical protein INH06_16090, partial [Cupriavidus sp.]|nr:hypothetical protein [Cupriavidus sp.]
WNIFVHERHAGHDAVVQFAHAVIADFLDRAGQYVTNDASREAAIADALAAQSADASNAPMPPLSELELHAAGGNTVLTLVTRYAITYRDAYEKLVDSLDASNAAPERFFQDHRLWHDRVTGQHMYTQDQYDQLRREAFHNGYASRNEEIEVAKHKGECADSECQGCKEGAGEPIAWLSEYLARPDGGVTLVTPHYKAINPEFWSDGFPVYRHALTRNETPLNLMRFNKSFPHMDESPDGEWVLFSDVEELFAGAANSNAATGLTVTDEMVSRFLGWKLPQDFYPDCYVSFDRDKASAPNASWPTGTNLLHAGQARAMLEYVLSAQSADASNAATGQGLTDDARECLQDVISHHAALKGTCRASELERIDSGDKDSADYWKHEQGALDRMKTQAERALLAAPAAPATTVSVHKTWAQVEQECNAPSRISAPAPAAPAPQCDTCNDTGQHAVGHSGRESDGNAMEFERCPECGYGDEPAPAAQADATVKDSLTVGEAGADARDAARWRTHLRLMRQEGNSERGIRSYLEIVDAAMVDQARD